MQSILDFIGKLRIAHHVPGRVRLKLEGELSDDLLRQLHPAKNFGNSLSQTPGIRSVSLNPLARSCSVEYDPELIEPSVWTDLLRGKSSPEVKKFLSSLSLN